ncbi:MAG: serine/threonine protein kinase [Polyangiaceae bacterium]
MASGVAEYGSIGPYRIVRRLGFGRKSEVLLATRLFPGNFERSVVIKRLLARCEDEPERQAVLAAEALAYARVAHPAIVQLFDFFSHEGHLALVLEYVDGLSLAKLLEGLRMRREPLSDGVALFIASRVFAALAAAHSAKDPRTGETTPVIHRDVSPSNVLIPWDGFVKLGDFDLSKVIGVSGDTRAGLMKGTYGYMAPEQVTGDPVTPRTDVYAGCLVLRELLLGRPAFDERLPELELLTLMLEARLPPIERMRAGIPRTLADAIGRGLSRDPEDRTFSAGEMVELLRAHADMELAHAELITRLGRVRSMVGEARGLLSQSAPTPPIGVPAALPETLRSSRWSLHTPRGVTIANANANMESLPPIEGHPPSAPPSRSVRSASAAGVLTAVGVLGLVFAVASNLRSPAQGAAASVDAPPASVSHPAPAPPSSAVAVPAPASAPVSVPPPASSLGAIIPPPAARHHRIWIDGEVAAWSQGPSLHVPCGTHVVRVGSAGASQSVDVPCGGSVALGSK